MATSNELFDTIIQGQRKMMDWWTESSEKMMGVPSKGKVEPPIGPEYIKDWYGRQQSLIEEASAIKNPQEALEKMPEQYKKWVDLQLEFQDKWMQAYKEGWNKMGYKLPDLNGYSPDVMFQNGWKLWNDKMQESSDWVKKNIMDKLPTSMQPHYSNFTGMYEDLYKSWTPFQRMIQYGIYDAKAVDSFFSPQQYQDVINKLMGFQSTANLKEGVNQVNEFFEQCMNFTEHFAPTYKNWETQWMDSLKQFNEMGHNPMIQTALDINQRIKENIEPFINILGYGKTGNFTKVLKDIQYVYTAYLLRMAELQNKVYKAGQHALPDTIKAFNEEYQETKKMPDFETFFNRLVSNLDEYLTDVLESDEYSLLQAKVSNLGITVKGKLDELIELSFDQTPFLMKSHGDDLAKEIHSLRRKVRDLEKKLKEVTAVKVEKPKPQPQPKPKAKTTRTTRAKATAK